MRPVHEISQRLANARVVVTIRRFDSAPGRTLETSSAASSSASPDCRKQPPARGAETDRPGLAVEEPRFYNFFDVPDRVVDGRRRDMPLFGRPLELDRGDWPLEPASRRRD